MACGAGVFIQKAKFNHMSNPPRHISAASPQEIGWADLSRFFPGDLDIGIKDGTTRMQEIINIGKEHVMPEPWSIEKALNRAIETSFLDPSLREEIRRTCLNEGEYFFGSDQTSGWLIEQNEDYICPFPYPYEPIWMTVEIPADTQRRCDSSATLCPALSNHEVEELNQENRIIHSNLTLLQILSLILPSGENDPQFQDICLQCLYACSPEESYIYYSSSDQWIQICRKFTDEEEAEFI